MRFRRTPRPGLILLYHRIAELERDPYRLAIHPERFRSQLEVLSRRVDLVPLADVRAPGPRPRVAVTFDDGYADAAGPVRETLERVGVPATVFVVAGMVGADEEFWWDRIERLVFDLHAGPVFEAVIGGRPLRVDTRNVAGRERAHVALYRRLRGLPPAEIERYVKELAGWSAAGVRETHRTLTEQELRTLAGSRVIEVGAHTLRHPRLTALPLDAQREEIAGGKALLERLAGTTTNAFSYPHGDYSPQTERLVREAGFRLACRSDDDVVRRRHSALALPRVSVFDWEPAELEQRLAGWVGA